MHFDELPRVRGLAHEEEYPFCAPVESNGLSLLDDDRFFLNGFEYLVQTQAMRIHACFTPVFREGSRHHSKPEIGLSTCYPLFPLCIRRERGEGWCKTVCRDDKAPGLIV